MTKNTETQIEGGYPRIMQTITYNYKDVNEEKLNNDTKLVAEHEAYIQNQSSKNDGKLDVDLYDCTEHFYKLMGLPSSTFIYSFDNAIEEELEEFARNDPWVKAGAVRNWTITLEVTTFSPCRSTSSGGDQSAL